MAKKKQVTFSVKVPDGFGSARWISEESLTLYRKWADKFDTYAEAAEAAKKRGEDRFTVSGNY